MFSDLWLEACPSVFQPTKGVLIMKNHQILSVAIGGLLALGLAGNASAADKKMERENALVSPRQA